MPDLRMPELNKVFLAGRLTRDPHIGNNVVHLSIASNRRYKDGNGEKQEQVTYTDVSAFGAVGEYASKLRKGIAVYIEGALSSYKKEDRNILTVNAQRISPLEWDGEKQGKEAQDKTQQQAQAQPPDDGIPF